MPGFFGDSDDEEESITSRAPPPPRAAAPLPRAGPSSERATSPGAQSVNGRADGHAHAARRSEDVDMRNGFLDSPPRSALPAARPARSVNGDLDAELEVDDNEDLVARMTRRWVNEREAPELLPHMDEDVERALELMRMQSNAIASIRKVETDISEEEHFRFIIVQQDMERVKYIIKNYVRTRQYKIERFSYFLLQNRDELVKLTPAERDYLKGYHRILTAHLHRSVLDSLPDELREISKEGMVPEPDLDKSVHILVKRPCGPVRLPGGTETLDLEVNTQHFLRYRTIREVLARGEVQLL